MLAPFQRRFVRGAFAPGISTAVLSCPRGAGKSTISGWLLAEALDPAGALFVPGSESVLVAGSRDQAAAVFRFLRAACGEDGFRYQDSGQRVGATHTRPARCSFPAARASWSPARGTRPQRCSGSFAPRVARTASGIRTRGSVSVPHTERLILA